MLDSLKRLFLRSAAPRAARADVKAWAEQRNYRFRPVRDDDGFVVEGPAGELPWRLEWGRSQRAYVPGPELRLRAEMRAAGDMQAMVLDRSLQVEMERSVFDQYVEGVQTRIDQQTPPEMRWLVLHPKLDPAELGALRERFAAVGAAKSWMLSWLDGGLTTSLLDAPQQPGQPMVLMLTRARMTLRVSLPDPTPDQLDAWLLLLHSALREARRVGQERGGADTASTEPGLWTGGEDAAEPPASR